MRNELLPASCSLGEEKAASQVQEWSDLVGRAAAIEALPKGARFWLPVDPAASVSDLAEREAGCCGFLDVDLRTTDSELVIEMRSANPDAWPVISALTGMAHS